MIRKQQLLSNQNRISKLFDLYDIQPKSIVDLTSKTKVIKCESEDCYLIKESKNLVENKFTYLSNLGLNNIIYPIYNKNQHYITDIDNSNYYVTPFYKTIAIVPEKKSVDLFNELDSLHRQTEFPRQLNPQNSRAKIDELTKQLDYKFIMLEEYIRSIEQSIINENNYQILSKYYRILDAKKELVRLQKRIILNIKDHESVKYVFVHNNPKLEHLLYIKGSKYLVSLDNGKLGIESLDFAKFYVENQNLNVDFQKLIKEHLLSYDSDFYYDYFRYLVLVIYIKRININKEMYLVINDFNEAFNCIDTYFANFNDRVINVEEE